MNILISSKVRVQIQEKLRHTISYWNLLENRIYFKV